MESSSSGRRSTLISAGASIMSGDKKPAIPVQNQREHKVARRSAEDIANNHFPALHNLKIAVNVEIYTRARHNSERREIRAEGKSAQAFATRAISHASLAVVSLRGRASRSLA